MGTLPAGRGLNMDEATVTVTVTLPQRVWQAVEDLLAQHLDERFEHREAWTELRGDN